MLSRTLIGEPVIRPYAVGDPAHVEKSFVRNLGDLVIVRNVLSDRFLNFTAAYFCAAGAIVALQGSYCLAILGALRGSAVIGGLLLLLYGYLYTLLVNQDYALLAGSVGLFMLLAVIMYLTRKIDWYSLCT